ncbi:MAG: zinc ribbon domain-containing protein [Acidobacteria bacterium]|nr:zinc ribbon domain-containing protein [Acidobacteriota bacterium]
MIGYEMHRRCCAYVVREWAEANAEASMFCPQCGHVQVSDETRFCSRCGLSLGAASELLAGSDEQLRREKRELTGVSLLLATVLMLLNFLIVFGVVTLPHLSNPVFLWIWLPFVVGSLATGGIGLASLLRSSYFRRVKERESRLYLSRVDERRQTLTEGTTSASINAGTVPLLAEPASVTETPTRELEAIPRDVGR